jgi:hypothetical protein
MSASRVTLEIAATEDEGGIEGMVEAFWEALRDAGIDGNVTIISVERVEDDE